MRAVFAVLGLTIITLAGCTSPAGGSNHLMGLPGHWAGYDYQAPDFDGGGPWLNTDAPISVDDLDGQVFLVDFWTYSCVNCIRTFPHLDGLYNTYKDHGFTIIGVHSPEFDFEKETDNVREAIEDYGIDYPVVQDNDFDVWRAYQGSRGFWPAHFLMDKDGVVKAYHIGEGAYAETEMIVRDLLIDAGATDLPTPFEMDVSGSSGGSGRTGELYAGYGRQGCTSVSGGCAIGNSNGYHPDDDVEYEADDAPARDRIYFDGTWHNGEESMTARTDGSVFLLFKAGAANFVADGPVGTCVPVLLDDEPIPEDLRGVDVQEGQSGPCIELDDVPRSYDFYAGPFEQHEVTFQVPEGFGLYTFAFSDEAME